MNPFQTLRTLVMMSTLFCGIHSTPETKENAAQAILFRYKHLLETDSSVLITLSGYLEESPETSLVCLGHASNAQKAEGICPVWFKYGWRGDDCEEATWLIEDVQRASILSTYIESRELVGWRLRIQIYCPPAADSKDFLLTISKT